jgi:hypothetical protein
LTADGAVPPKSGFAFPDTLCHSCAAPPRYVTSDRGSVFIYCPIFKRYPPQPVHHCTAYSPRENRGA